MNNKYKHFWSWFIHNKQLFEEPEISDKAIELIDQQINRLGDFTWEIGPGIIKSLSLTISPGGDRNLLAITREIVSQAPIIDNWEFYYAKPVKEWDNYFDVIIDEKKIGIDISNWEYILFRNDNGNYDIQIKPDNIPAILLSKENQIYGIVEMALESIIGEERRLEKIDDLEVVSEFDDDIKKNGISILNLQDHLKNR
jgi:hypothetical protein